MPPTSPPPTPPANAERLLKLREDAVQAPAGDFCMSYYRCGTKHCGAGWYVEKNPDCGLKFISDDPGNPYSRDYVVPASFFGTYENSPDAYTTLAGHFGLTRSESFMLFGPDFDGEPGEEQKQSFLQELDALLTARGIAPAAARAAEGAAK